MTKYKSKFTGQQIDDGIEYGVRVTQQTFSSAQKQQARENIGVTPEVQVGGNTPASDSGVKIYIDENSDDTVEVYTKAQANGQFMVVVNSVSVPTSSTLTYTATDGTTKSFKVGDEIRVPDAEADNGYTFYKLYALTTESNVTTATWDKLGAGGGSAAGFEIVAASGTTLTAEVGKYYRYDSDVTNLAVTLPTITGATEVQEFVIYMKTSSSFSGVTFTGGTIQKIGVFYIKRNSTYEINVTWNGEKWVLETNESPSYDSVVGYIQNPSQAYIDTGFYYQTGHDVSYILDYTVVGSVSGQSYFGSRNSNYSAGNGYSGIPYNGSVYVGVTNFGTFNAATNTRYTLNVYISGGGTTCGFTQESGGSTVASNSKSITKLDSMLNSIVLFGDQYDGGVAQNCTGIRVHSFKIIDNGTIVRDYIPVRVGQVGYLFDRISNVLSGNSGSGSFTFGSDI